MEILHRCFQPTGAGRQPIAITSIPGSFQDYTSAPTQNKLPQAPLNQPYPQYQQYPQAQPTQGPGRIRKQWLLKRKARTIQLVEELASGKALMNTRPAAHAVVASSSPR